MLCAQMAEIKHTFLQVNGINMHVAELGSGPVVVLLHGFPEIWYSWRHQIRALATAGFRAIAPDFRGYGLTENSEPEKNTYSDLADDIVGLLDAIGEDKAFVVAKDFGVFVAHVLGLVYPQRVKALVNIGIGYIAPPMWSLLVGYLPDGHYAKRWAERGRPEADFGRFDVSTVVKRIYILFCNSEMPLAPEGKETLDLVDGSAPLPDWLTENDLKVYAELYQKSGFGYPMELPYRCWERSAARLSHLQDFDITVPVLTIIGRKDYAAAVKQSEANANRWKENIPKLELIEIEEGNHFVQEQLPEQVNKAILDFLIRLSTSKT
eukprot:c17154_g1_i1 orf=490-1455(-)